MTRIRTIKPTFWTSQTLARVSRDARLVFAGLFNEADDEGRLPDSPKRLAGAVFPFDDDVTAEWMSDRLTELASVGALVRYEVGGSRFISIPQFNKHQVINRPRPSAIPPPFDSRSPHGVLTESSVEEWNGMEGNGREPRGEGHALSAGAIVDAVVVVAKKAPQLTGRADRKDTIFGKIETEAMPSTAQQILKDPHWGPIIREKFPAWDGRGSRLSLATEITSDLKSFRTKYLAEGKDAAYSGLLSWLSRRYGAAEASRRAEQRNASSSGAVDVTAIIKGNRP